MRLSHKRENKTHGTIELVDEVPVIYLSDLINVCPQWQGSFIAIQQWSLLRYRDQWQDHHHPIDCAVD